MNGLPGRRSLFAAFLFWGLPSAAFAVGPTECRDYLKLLGCRVSHMSPSQRAKAARGVRDSINNLKRKMRNSSDGRCGQRKALAALRAEEGVT